MAKMQVVNKTKDGKKFRRVAGRMNKKNLNLNAMRGGTRM